MLINYHMKLEGDGIHAFECPISREAASVTILSGRIESIGCEHYGDFDRGCSSRYLCKFNRGTSRSEVPGCLFGQKEVRTGE
jgi:hypothetical protein